MKRLWKVSIVALIVALLFAAAACAQAEGVLKESTKASAFGGPIAREEVRSVTFVDTLADAPADAWDASEAGDGSVLAWAEKSGDLYDVTVTVGGEGGVQAPEDCSEFFGGFEGLEQLNFNDCFDTSHVTDMSHMFEMCWRLRELDLRCFDTSRVQNMWGMFANCMKLQSSDISSFDTSAAENMDHMFFGCSTLEKLDLSSFDTSSVENMGAMFCYCNSLSELDLRGFDTSKVEDMNQMFFDCSGLTELDLTGFDTGKVENMLGMFDHCTALESVQVSDKFAIGADTDTTDMFSDCGVSELTYTSAPAAEAEASAEEEAPVEEEAPSGDYETLRRGDKGPAVAKFQAKLVEHNYLADVADGDFGGKTEAAVKQVQADAGLEQTGIADAATQAALENLTADFEPQGGFSALLYWGEYDAEAQVLSWYVKNTGEYELNGMQFIFQQCDASKTGVGDFSGYKNRDRISVYPAVVLEHIQPGESHRFTVEGIADGVGECVIFPESVYASVSIDAIVGLNENGEVDGKQGDHKKIYIPLS